MERRKSLFCKGDLGATLDNLAGRARADINKLSAGQIDPRNEEVLLAKLKHDFVVNPLQLDRGKMTREGPYEVDIHIDSRDARHFNYAGSVTLRGIEVTFVIPFDGDPWLFDLRPNSWTLMYPEGEILGQEYRLTLRDPEKNVDRMKQSRDSQLQQVEDYIRRQKEQVKDYNQRILTVIKNAIEQRRRELNEIVACGDSFGVPERTPTIVQTDHAPRTVGQSKAARHAGTRNVKLHIAAAFEHGPNVFVCYAKEDVVKAEEVFVELRTAGADPWLDKRKLVLGDEWEHEIKKAVRGADAFVACLRPGFDDIGFRQQEVRWAIEALQRRPPGKGFIIPFIIEPCALPDWCKPFHAGGDLSKATTIDELIRAVEKHCSWTTQIK